MQFIDLSTQQERIKDKIDARIQTVLSHGQYIMGPEVQELEDKLASYVGVKHAIGCASGTDALLLALMAQGVGPGDAVFTTPFTFIASSEMIGLLGVTPIFVDIDPRTFNLNPSQLDKAIAALKAQDPRIYPLPDLQSSIPCPVKCFPSGMPSQFHPGEAHLTGVNRQSSLVPKGVIAVDLFGLPADYDRINAIAQEHGLFVIEDAAQSFGAEHKGRKAGCLAEIACTSFFPAKPLGCYGDGGMCFTGNDDLADLMRSIRIHGKGDHKYDNVRIGINGRLDTLQAAILLAKFEIFPDELELRQQVAHHYTSLFTAYCSLPTQVVPFGYKSSWSQYSILAQDEQHRFTLQARLKKAGIPTAIYYPKALHLQTAFGYLGYREGDFPVSESVSQRILSLPMHPYLSEDKQKQIIRAMSNVVK